MTVSLALRSRNRGVIPVCLQTMQGTVQSVTDIEAQSVEMAVDQTSRAASKSKTKSMAQVTTKRHAKPARQVLVKTAEGTLKFRLSNATIGLREGHEICLVYYQAEGYLQRLAGFHNLSKTGSYILHQPKDYFHKWLQVRALGSLLLLLWAAPILISTAVFALSKFVAACVLLFSAVAAYVIYKKISKKYILVSGVHYKSFLLQLLDGFKQCGPDKDSQ